MKPGRKSWKKIMHVFRQICIMVLAVGTVLFLNEYTYAKITLSVGGILLSIYAFLKGFEPVYEEPNWELVYPELGLGFSEDLEKLAKENNKKNDEL